MTRPPTTDSHNLTYSRNEALLLCRVGCTEEAIARLRNILSLDPDDIATARILAIANEIAAGQSAQVHSLPQSQTSQTSRALSVEQK